MAAIETVELTRYYGDLCAVDGLTLAVERGELLGFLGPNGAGKTTTIRMLTGLLRPTQGRAYIDGVDVAEDPLAAKARIGVVPQRSNLYGELSVRDNLIFMAKLYGLPRRRWRARVDELLGEYGLADRADSPFTTLSGGLKRRLTVAAALVHEPAILFLDEPTSGLDVQSARNLRARIQALRESGVTVFLTTHLIHEAEQLADRVAIIVRGKLVALDTPGALRARCRGDEVLVLDLTSVDEVLLAALRRAPAIVSVSRSGDSLHLVTNALAEAVTQAVGVVGRHGVALRGLHTAMPSLEEAFVQLTNMSLETMQGGNSISGGGGGR